jgi:ABC-type branched-subunit amino acid transport system ATPase component
MAFWSKREEPARKGPVLVVEGLDVYYGRAHALQTVSFSIEHGVLGIVGRNGMGKTTLCNAITGLVPATGSVKLFGEELLGRAANEITKRGIAYVPQGRRVWPSLSVDETLKLVAQNAKWTACMRCSRAWPSARATAARSSVVASSRCSRSAARSCCSRSCW